jgi:AcrR family transcriptional regulator
MPRAQREQLILNVAGAVFARAGYHPASMEEIAAGAGISKPMLYAYFGSKEGLYVAYINRSGHELLDRLQHVFSDEDPTPVRLRSRVGEFLAFVEENRDGWRVLWGEANASRPVAQETAQLRAQITDAVRALVTDGPAGTRLTAPAAEAVAHSIVGAGEALANWWLEHPEIGREQVANWYASVVQATVISLAGGADARTGSSPLLRADARGRRPGTR